VRPWSPRVQPCLECDGSGFSRIRGASNETLRCWRCNGTGVHPESVERSRLYKLGYCPTIHANVLQSVGIAPYGDNLWRQTWPNIESFYAMPLVYLASRWLRGLRDWLCAAAVDSELQAALHAVWMGVQASAYWTREHETAVERYLDEMRPASVQR